MVTQLYITPLHGDTEELIVAVCTEDVSWVDGNAHNYKKVTIYNKCGNVLLFKSDNVKVITTPNIGSCDYAFLSYIIERYDDLPDFMEFLKGSCRPVGKYNDCVSCVDHLIKWDRKFKIVNYPYTNHTGKEYMDQPWYDSGYSNIEEWVNAQDFVNAGMYERNSCNIIYGGQFGATAKHVRKTPKTVWQQLRSQQKHPREEIDHFIERTWRILLCRPSYKLVIVAIFKNESNVMREWL
jgi:hypothetical protein